MLTVGFSCVAFIMLGTFLLFLVCWEYFYLEGMLNFFKCLFCISWDDYVAVFLHSVNVVDFCILNLSCILGINPTLSRYITVFVCFVFAAAFCLLVFWWGFLHLYSWGMLVYNFFCTFVSLLIFVIRVILAS